MNSNMAEAPRTSAAKGTQSIERVVALLRALTPQNKRGASAAELAATVSIERTTAHRILKCLAEEGMLSFDQQSRRYRLGPLVSEMGAAASEVLDLPALCRPTLMRIADDVGDTVFLMVRRGDEATCADRISGYYPIKTFVVDVGTRRPLGIGAGSMAILAALPNDVASLLLEQNALRYARYQDLTQDQIKALMALSRERGYVVMDVVEVEGVRAVGVPVLVRNRPVAALSIASIAVRMTDARVEQLASILKREAEALGQSLEAQVHAPNAGP